MRYHSKYESKDVAYEMRDTLNHLEPTVPAMDGAWVVMPIINHNEISGMHNITQCSCGKLEYVGMMHWRNSKQHCRHCINHIWNKDRNQFDKDWFNYYFPHYEDGSIFLPIARHLQSQEGKRD